MSEFKIERNIPLPPRKTKYPWATMAVGDSFFVPGKPGDDSFHNVFSAAMVTQRKLRRTGRDVTFTVRRCEGGTRVWRTT
jgi:hypothetical protein